MKKTTVIRTALCALLAAASLLAGCGNQAADGKGQEIKIGALFPLTGGASNYGLSLKQGAELAATQINAKGGVNGKQISLLVVDDKNSPTEGITAAQKLITQDKVSAIIGDHSSSVTLAVRDVTERERVVQLTPSSGADNITEPGHPFMFRNLMPNNLQAPLVAKYATQTLHKKRIAILAESTDYGRTGADSFQKVAEASGGQIIATEFYKPGDKDFYAQLTNLKGLAPEAVFLPGNMTEGTLILKQAKELGIATQWLGLAGFAFDKFLELADGAAEGMILPSYFEADAPQFFPHAGTFVENYSKAFNRSPDMLSIKSYEAVYILAEAIKLAGSEERDRIRDGLMKIKDLQLVTEPIAFDENGQVNQHILLAKIENGKRVPLVSSADVK